MLTTGQKIYAARAATAVRRLAQDLRVRELKVVRYSPSQSERLQRMFLEAKWLRNSIIATGIFTHNLGEHGVHVKLPSGELEKRELTVLPAHVKQTIRKNLETAVKSLASNKRAGRIVGAVGYTREVKSLEFPTGDIKVRGTKAFIPKVGWIRVRGIEQLGEEIANVHLVKRPSGYYLLVASLSPKNEQPVLEGDPLGLDFGVRTHITTSENDEWNLAVQEPESLKRLQRKLGRQQKGSKNYEKTLVKIQLAYERLDRLKDEAANQFVASLKTRSLIVFQDENLRGWKARRNKKRGYGRVLQHSALGRVKGKLRSLPQSVMVDRFAPTTQYCPACSSLNRLKLSEREYKCDCGYSAPRDAHAARNMLILGEDWQDKSQTPREPGSAPVDWKAAAAIALSYLCKPHQVEAGNSDSRIRQEEISLDDLPTAPSVLP